MGTNAREELRRRVRVEKIMPDGAADVIRGGPDTRSLLRGHARRLHHVYVLDGEPVFGVSVFVVLDDLGPTSERGILSEKLKTYPMIYRCPVRDLSDRGLWLQPTFRRPHSTVVLPELRLVDALAAALGTVQLNPYAERREEDR
jgi:hypothetical protein